MRRDIMTEIIIAAPRAAVWDALIGFSGWRRWNPLVPLLAGEATTGSRLTLHLHLPGRQPRLLHPEVLRVLPAEELSWISRLWVPGLLDCEHRFLLETPDAGDQQQTLLIQRLRLSGIVLPLFWPGLRSSLAAGLHESNRGLRDALSAPGSAGFRATGIQ
ncbi:MAG: SRPBCC domain-containing protein [Aquisalimonadaceae bacterium]